MENSLKESIINVKKTEEITVPDHHMAHTTVLMWGSLFCLLAAWCMGKDKNYNREKKRWMLHMQLFTALFLSSEAFAWAFDGRRGWYGSATFCCF